MRGKLLPSPASRFAAFSKILIRTKNLIDGVCSEQCIPSDAAVCSYCEGVHFPETSRRCFLLRYTTSKIRASQPFPSRGRGRGRSRERGRGNKRTPKSKRRWETYEAEAAIFASLGATIRFFFNAAEQLQQVARIEERTVKMNWITNSIFTVRSSPERVTAWITIIL